MRKLVVSILLFGWMPAAFAQPPCAHESQQLQIALMRGAAPDPSVMESVARDQQEGMRLCYEGKSDEGRAKLLAALELLAPAPSTQGPVSGQGEAP